MEICFSLRGFSEAVVRKKTKCHKNIAGMLTAVEKTTESRIRKHSDEIVNRRVDTVV